LEPLLTEYIKINYARAENFRNLLNGLDTGAFGACGADNSSGGGSGSGGSSSSGGTQGFQSNQGSPIPQQNQSSQGANGNNQDGTLRVLSSRGSAVVDARTNTLIVRETAKRLEEAKKLIRRLDVPVRQVMVEVRIASASSNFAKTLGVRFGVAKQGNAGGSKNFAIGGAGTRGNSTSGATTVTDTLVDLAAGSPYGALGMTLARGADYVLNLELSALQDQGQGELLSNPRVMTSDRCRATIKQGVQLPYQTTSGNLGTTTIFVDAALSLDVTPQITPSGSVVMALKVTKDAAGAVTPDGIGIDTQQIETNVHVMDGETVVLGGVFQETLNDQLNKVPFFADLPGIGFLFKRTTKQDDKNELLIFVTPKVIKDTVVVN
jgi:type IV pilus assembly protein PilQ